MTHSGKRGISTQNIFASYAQILMNMHPSGHYSRHYECFYPLRNATGKGKGTGTDQKKWQKMHNKSVPICPSGKGGEFG